MEQEKDEPPRGYNSTDSDSKQTNEKYTGTPVPFVSCCRRKTGHGWEELWAKEVRSSEPGFATHHLCGLG